MIELENRIRQLLEEILGEADSYLVELRVGAGKVEVFADRDPHITIDDCVKISRRLEKQLDTEFPFSEQYTLEVSSPGMDQPFKVMKQFKKSVGREVEVILISGVKKSGMLIYADEEKIVVEENIKRAKHQTEIIRSEVPFVNIKSTQLVFNFPRTTRE